MNQYSAPIIVNQKIAEWHSQADMNRLLDQAAVSSQDRSRFKGWVLSWIRRKPAAAREIELVSSCGESN